MRKKVKKNRDVRYVPVNKLKVFKYNKFFKIASIFFVSLDKKSLIEEQKKVSMFCHFFIH
jgi:hypothetical protein